jgi:hypothetical protein
MATAIVASALNKRQKQILLLGIALIVLSELFPHWVYFDAMTSGKRSAGYHFFTNKPEIKSRDEMLKIFPVTREDYDFMQSLEVKPDRLRILLQRLLLSVFTLGLVILFKNNLSLGWIIVVVPIICFGLWLLYLWNLMFRLDDLIPH